VTSGADAEVLLAACSAGAAVLVSADARGLPRRRVQRLLRVRTAARAHDESAARVIPSAAVLILVAAVLLATGAVIAAVALVAVVAGPTVRRSREAGRRRREAARCAVLLPRAADLVAACLDAGVAPAEALELVRREIGDPLATRLAPVVGSLRAGTDPLVAYGDHGPDDPVRVLVRAVARALESGAPLAATIANAADDQRRRQRWAAEAAARRAGVLAVGPLVVCFLPAFVLLGVVPVILGIAADVLTGFR
jgi:pilus assembly protein TadC